MVSCNTDIGDIEDINVSVEHIFNTNSKPPVQLLSKKNQLVPKVRRKKPSIKYVKECVVADSIIPGTQTLYIKTWGCAHNNSDSEYMAGLLAAYGYTITEEPSVADLWLLNSCTVKGPSEEHLRNAVESARQEGRLVVVAGCVSQGTPNAPFLKGLSLLGVQQIDRVVEIIEETLKGNNVHILGSKRQSGQKLGGAALSLPKIRKNPLVEIIPISTGCLNQCTYCKTKHARGQLGSYPIQEILDRAKQAFSEGVKELWLTSEDLGAYGRDLGLTLPDLLRPLVETVPKGCMMRLGMTNPPYILDHLEEIGEILNHERMYAFLHIPVQSGSDAVLKDMKREYSVEHFEKVVLYLRQNVPDLTIATDMICGFPTEDDEDFEESIQLIKRWRFPTLFINQFYPRPGTPAAKLKRLPTKLVKERTKHMTELFQSYTTYESRLGQEYTILVTEESHDTKHYVGHNKSYEQVLVPKDPQYLGREVKVRIKSVGKHFLMGEPLEVCILSKTTSQDPLSKRNQSALTEVQTNLVGKFSWHWFSVFAIVIALLIRCAIINKGDF